MRRVPIVSRARRRIHCSGCSNRSRSSSDCSSPARYSSEAQGPLQQGLQSGLQRRNRSLRFVGRIAEEFSLLVERMLEPYQHCGHRLRQRMQFFDLAGFLRHIQLTIVSQHYSSACAGTPAEARVRARCPKAQAEPSLPTTTDSRGNGSPRPNRRRRLPYWVSLIIRIRSRLLVNTASKGLYSEV